MTPMGREMPETGRGRATPDCPAEELRKPGPKGPRYSLGPGGQVPPVRRRFL